MSQISQVVSLIFLLILTPLATWYAVSNLPEQVQETEIYSGGTSYDASELPFRRTSLENEIHGLPLITNVQVFDLDQDGQNEILVCDAQRNQISAFRRSGDEWREEVLVTEVSAPAHVTPVDIDQDGDLDLVASVLGNIMPDDESIGRVEIFEQEGEGYIRHVVLDNVRRVADVEAGDFDGDGDPDLAVAVFGYSRGAVLWLENLGEWKFRDRELHNAPGAIHVPVADFDGDGDLDIATVISQDEEELWGFENLGSGEFRSRRLWFSWNMDLGSAGLIQADLDQDGDADLILPVGDNLEDFDAYPQPYHGCYWFENEGDWTFREKRIADLGGTYAAATGDLDGDSDLDIALVSMTNNWYAEQNASVVWLENDGEENFRTWQIDQSPIHLVTVDIGDVNGDGKQDIVAGALNFRKPYERIGRVSAWMNLQGGQE